MDGTAPDSSLGAVQPGSADRSLPGLIVAGVVEELDAPGDRAAAAGEAIELFERSSRRRDSALAEATLGLIGLDGDGDRSDGSRGIAAGGLAAIADRADGMRAAGRCGDGGAELYVLAAARATDGRIEQANAIYDAERDPGRHLEAVEQVDGEPAALAARLGCLAAAAEPSRTAHLAAFGRELAVASRIAQDARELEHAPADGRPSNDPRIGDYSLPILFAVATDPGLARQLGGSIDLERLRTLVDRVRAAGGFQGAWREWRARTDRARRELEAASVEAGPLAELAAAIVDPEHEAEAQE